MLLISMLRMLRKKSNFCVKCDNTPADYGVFFEFAESISGFSLLWGVTPYANS